MTDHDRHGDASRPADHRNRMAIGAILAAVLVVLVSAAAIGWAVVQQEQGGGAGEGVATAETESAATETPRQTETSTADAEPEDCPEATVEVSSADELQQALDDAKPGAVIGLAPGAYQGEFTATVDGRPDAAITVCGTAESILDGGGIEGGYVFHLDNVAHWVLQGFAVQNGQKGVMADGTTGSVIRGLQISGVGDEAIHLRDSSTDNRVVGNTITDTGLRKPKFGEGIYIGTAESNWCDITDCEPDPSDRNVIEANSISRTTSESIDIKEGTSDGIVRGNSFDGSSLVEADSWVDVKGNGWLIDGNTGTHSAADGFQTHEILDGWGTGNIFRDNSAQLEGSGTAFSLTPERDNVLECSNTVSDSGAQLSNVECTN
jgi:hypothetical protein